MVFLGPSFASIAATLAFVGPELDFETLDEGKDEVEDEVEGLDESDFELREPLPNVRLMLL